MKKEVFSTGYPLNPESRDGYTISIIGGGLLEVRFDTVEPGVVSYPFRVPAEHLPPERYDDLDLLGELTDSALYGTIDGAQVKYHGKWYSADTIRKIQSAHDDPYWQRHV
nr:MAG TPA: hypothetical protein [Caudoviricetes sp.]